MQNDNRSEIRRVLGHGLQGDTTQAETFIVIRSGIYRPSAPEDDMDVWDLGIYLFLSEVISESR